MRPVSRRSLLKGVGAAFGMAGLGLQAVHGAGSQPNLVLVIIDTLRADHLSCYGYSRPTTPNLDQFAQTGTKFTTATSAASWTTPSNAALWTGYAAQRSTANWYNPRLPATFPTLAEQLKAAGYLTVGFNTAPMARAQLGFSRGFDVFNEDGLPPPPNYSNSANHTDATATDAALAWLNQHAPTLSQPLFLMVYYYAPHSWYNAPDDLAGRPNYSALFTDPGYAGPWTANYFADGQRVLGGELPDAAGLQNIIGLYDGEIRYADDEFGRLLAGLNSHNLLNNGYLTVTADHGELFGEYGKWLHSTGLQNQLLHVPLIMAGPNIPANQTIATSTPTMDVMPTYLECAGLAPAATLDAHSLWPLLQGTETDHRACYAEVDLSPQNPALLEHNLRSLQFGEWKYVHVIGAPELDGLYHLPDETTDRSADFPQRAADFKAAIVRYFRLHKLYAPLVRR